MTWKFGDDWSQRFFSKCGQSWQTKVRNWKSCSGVPDHDSRGFNLWANGNLFHKAPIITLVDDCHNLIIPTESAQFVNQFVRNARVMFQSERPSYLENQLTERVGKGTKSFVLMQRIGFRPKKSQKNSQSWDSNISEGPKGLPKCYYSADKSDLHPYELTL